MVYSESLLRPTVEFTNLPIHARIRIYALLQHRLHRAFFLATDFPVTSKPARMSQVMQAGGLVQLLLIVTMQ